MKTLNEPNVMQSKQLNENPHPEYFRLPSPGSRCLISGLSRTGVEDLLDSGKVKHIKLKKPGKKRGVTLINRQSFLDYLHSLEQ
jgi:hypothetical protein